MHARSSVVSLVSMALVVAATGCGPIAAGIVVALDSGGGGSSGGAPPSAPGSTGAVGPAGGVVTAAGVSITIPPGALTESVAFSVVDAADLPTQVFVAVGAAKRLEPRGRTFSPPLRLDLPYDPSRLPSGSSPSDLVVLLLDEATGDVLEVRAESVNPNRKTVTLQVTSLSACQVAVRAGVDLQGSTVTLDPTALTADGSQQARVDVRVLNVAGHPLPNRDVTLLVSGSGNSVVQPGDTDLSGLATGWVASTVAEAKTITVRVAPGVELLQRPVVTFFPPGPAAPTALSVAGVTTSSVALVWSENAVNETGVQVERRPSGAGGYAAVATLPPNSTAYTDPNLTDGTAYDYRVVAFNAGGVSAPSNAVTATTDRVVATRLVVTAQPPDTVSGQVLTLTVEARDATGSLDRSYSGNVQLILSSGPSPATLDGTLVKPAVAGVAAFAAPEGVSLELTGTYTLRVASPPLTQTFSDAFQILPLPNGPRVTSFSVTPSQAAVGESVQLDWTISGSPNAVVLEPGAANVTGTLSATRIPFPAASTSPAWFKVRATDATWPREVSRLSYAKRAGGTGTGEEGTSVAAVPGGGAVVTGAFRDTATFGPGEANQTTLVSASTGTVNVFVARYAADGTLVWAKRAGGSERSQGYGVDTYPDGSSVVTGTFYDVAVFGVGELNQTTLTTSLRSGDVFVARYDPNGNLSWAKQAGTPGQFDFGRGVTALPDGSAVVAGHFNGLATFGSGEPNETQLDSGATFVSALFVARYNADGSLAWARKAGHTNSNAYGYGVTSLPDQSTIVAGSFDGRMDFPGLVRLFSLSTESSITDTFLAKYDANGTFLWAKQAGGAGATRALAEGVASLADGRVVLTGYVSGSATFGAGEANQTTVTPTSNLFDMFVASYLPDGTLAWVRHAGGDRDCRGNAIATFPDGSCAVAGFFDETATFGLGEAGQTDLSARGPFQDGFVARYHSDGTLAGVVRAGGRSNDQVLGVASQPDGGLFATGFFGNAAAFGPGEANQTILNTAGSDDIFLFHLKPMNYRMLEVQPR